MSSVATPASSQLQLVLGIDSSAQSTGVSLIKTNYSSYVEAIQPKKLREGERLLFIYNRIASLVLQGRPSLIVMEAPSFGSTSKKFTLGEVHGVIKLLAAQHSIPVILAAPKAVKKYATRRGTSGKEEMIKAAGESGCPSDQEDICDSWFMALIGLDLLEGKARKPTRAKLEVLKVIKDSHAKQLAALAALNSHP
jgi:Holliday junction resolvasome RuvABC endonuclease subunit